MKQALELRCALMLTVSPLLAAGPSAFAQDEISSTPKQEHEGPLLEEIVVTADRSGFGADLVQAGSFRGARQLDTPLTVSVIPKALLDTQQAASLYDALRNTAGRDVPRRPRRPSTTISRSAASKWRTAATTVSTARCRS